MMKKLNFVKIAYFAFSAHKYSDYLASYKTECMTITNFTRPSTIQEGDTIGILSTARAIEQEELLNAKNHLNEKGFNVVYGATIGAKHHQFAGDDELRLNDLQTMIDTPEVDAIICARGGYGTARLLEQINWSNFKENPKWIMGYSDITALHNALSQIGIMSLHGIMPINIKDNESKQALDKALAIMCGQSSFSLDLQSHKLNHSAPARGILTGGNLSMLYSLRGTKYDFESRQRILFIEDLDEYLYHIDRMMVNFKLSDILTNISALVVGGMTDMNDNTIAYGYTAEEIIESHMEEDIPVFFNAPFGHFPGNHPLVCGAQGNISNENNQWKLNYKL